MKQLYFLVFFTFFTSFIFSQNALNFDGVDDFIQTNNLGVLGSNNRTFEAWINVSTNAPSSNLTILDYGLNSAGSRNTFLIDPNLGPRFLSGGANGNLPGASIGVTAGQWFHVAFVLDNGVGYTYVNGVQASTGNLSNVSTPAGNQEITIGERVPGGSIPFAGSIDEIRVWNTARSPAEILADMNRELCSYPPSLVTYYKFNQGLVSGNNMGLTNVIGELGDTAFATNFSMSGIGSNWATGASIGLTTPFDFGVMVDTANQIISSIDTSANIHYQWYDCDTNSILVGDTNRSLLSRSGGNYAVILSKGTCIDTSSCFNVSFNTGVQLGEALNFDGVDDFVKTTFPGVTGRANRTFEAWIRINPNTLSSGLAIMDYGLNTIGSRNTLLVNISKGVSYISGGTNANIGTPQGVITTGRWTHVAFVLDNGVGSIYIDGVQEATGILSAVNTPVGGDSLIIGQRIIGGSIPFDGDIDDLRIWNVARTSSEIMADMNSEFCSSANISGLVAHFNMNSGISRGNNTGVIKLLNSVSPEDGFMNNFALTGSNSNFIAPGAGIPQAIIDTSVSLSGITLTSNELNADTYQWFSCNTNSVIVGATSSTYSTAVSGDYAVILSKNGCVDTSSCVNLIGVGIEKVGFKSNFYLSQNPVVNELSLINQNEMTVNVELRSITGKLIQRLNQVRNKKINFNMESESSGIYFLSIQGESNSVATYKVVKQ